MLCGCCFFFFSFGKVLKCSVRSSLYFTVTIAGWWKYIHPMKVMVWENLSQLPRILECDLVPVPSVLCCLGDCSAVSPGPILLSLQQNF